MRHRRFDKAGALGEFEIDHLPGLALFDEIGAPALKPVGPRFDRVAPASDAIRPDARHPSVVVVKREARLLPHLILKGVMEDGPELVVAVAEQIGPDFDGIADNALCRIPPAIDLGIDVLDNYPSVRPSSRPMRQLGAS